MLCAQYLQNGEITSYSEESLHVSKGQMIYEIVFLVLQNRDIDKLDFLIVSVPEMHII